VLTVVKAKKRTAPSQARNLLGIIKRLFAWAVDQRTYGIGVSPAAGLKPTSIIGEKPSGQRILDDSELFALWRAAGRIPYPYGPVYRLLILTGLRLNEAADAARTEFDPAVAALLRSDAPDKLDRLKSLPADKRVWIIPAERMKGRAGKARAHAVPLTDDILAVVAALPVFRAGGPYLFSTTFGEKPAWLSDKVKKRVDARMLRTLRALTRSRRDDPGAVKLVPWKNHDIRRTVRSNLSRLRVTEEAREALLAHARPGIKGVYDRYDYWDEKWEALNLWAARLNSITGLAAGKGNVISLHSIAQG
ncbi:MAG: hypothetical protein J0H99_06495, partial [Rhodospirillales bacterium]|nr:hypothetical protein [Rhodospirillales bacterium]